MSFWSRWKKWWGSSIQDRVDPTEMQTFEARMLKLREKPLPYTVTTEPTALVVKEEIEGLIKKLTKRSRKKTVKKTKKVGAKKKPVNKKSSPKRTKKPSTNGIHDPST